MPIKEQCTHLLDWIGLTGEGEGAQAPEVHTFCSPGTVLALLLVPCCGRSAALLHATLLCPALSGRV